MTIQLMPMLEALGSINVTAALLRFFKYVVSTKFWKFLVKYSLLALSIFWKMLVSRISYRVISILEKKTPNVFLLEQDLPVEKSSAKRETLVNTIAPVPALEFGFTSDEIESFDEFTRSDRAELFLEDLRQYFLRYGMEESFARFFITGKTNNEVSDVQRLETLFKQRPNSRFEFAHLLAAYPEMEAIAYKNESSDKRRVQQWILSKLYSA